MGAERYEVVTLAGIPLGVDLEWPFHANVSGADFHVLHGKAELGDGSGLHAMLAIHLTTVVAERMAGLEPEHTLGPVLGAIRKQTDRKQLEFLRSDKRQPIAMGARFQNFRTKQWVFETATDEQVRRAVLQRLFWAGSRAVRVDDAIEALYLGTSVERLAEVRRELEIEGLLRGVEGGVVGTEALKARGEDFETRAREAIRGIQEKHAFEQERVSYKAG